jgi:LacI family transcriptional regulator
VLCQLSDPPLSSVDPNAQKIGYEAAAALHRAIEGSEPPPDVTLIEPAGVVVRRSTDVLVIADQDVVNMVRYIREHACDGLTTQSLSEQAAISRRTLERWFAEHVGHSPSEEIARVRIERVKDLLLTTELALEEIAPLAGFEHLKSMHRLFKSRLGLTPGEYRKSCKTPGAGNERESQSVS